MQRHDKIYVAGHRGLVGSALVRRLITYQSDSPLRDYEAPWTNVITKRHSELDLTDQSAVRDFMQEARPDYVFLAAAKVGGIHANSTYPAEFVHSNLAIQTNVIHEAWRAGVKRLMFLGSSCIYPRDSSQPIKEEYLLTGPLEATNRPYAVAKIAGIEMCWSYNRQYGTQFLPVMPTNLFGPGDNYDLENSHVLPALVRKMHEAKEGGEAEVTVWGTGAPRREFLYSDDLADACIYLMQLPENASPWGSGLQELEPPLINVGCGKDITIRELAETIADVVGFEGHLHFDLRKPDGTPRKLLDVSRLSRLGWRATTPLKAGLRMAYADFLARHRAEVSR
jgi:GDP-L-fucose synthase